jgi:hypothetical protein
MISDEHEHWTLNIDSRFAIRYPMPMPWPWPWFASEGTFSDAFFASSWSHRGI